MAGGAGTTHVAGVLDVDLVVEKRLADGGPSRGGDFSAVRTVFGMRQYLDDGHK
jgi:hypothetical protein